MSALERLKQRRAAPKGDTSHNTGVEGCDGGHGVEPIAPRPAAGGGGAAPTAEALPSAQPPAIGRGRLAASASHEANDAYMARFSEVLGVAEGPWPAREQRPQRQSAGAVERRPGGAAARQQAHQAAAIPAARGLQASSNSSSSIGGSSRNGAPAVACSWPEERPRARGVGPPRLAAAWRARPAEPAGAAAALSERPLLCSEARPVPAAALERRSGGSRAAVAAAADGEVVLGSADHALYVIDAATAARRRTLFSPSTGHKEWVCCHAPHQALHSLTGRQQAGLSGASLARRCLPSLDPFPQPPGVAHNCPA
jgi:hypothetical protein